MNEIYFEAKGEALLEKIGMSKAEFARRMGIQRQNVKALFKSKDLRVIQKAADVIGVPWIFLVGYTEKPDIYQLPMLTYEEYLDFARQYPGEYDVPDNDCSDDPFEIAPEDIPTGDSVEDRRRRQKIIFSFYKHWRETHPEMRMFNDSLGDWIYVRHISVEETAGHASLTYLSTLAVLQLDTIMRDAVYVGEKGAKSETQNQKQFTKMIQLRHTLPGIGRVRLMVGVKKQDKTKVQYCITSIDAMREAKKQGSLK
ncbi:MAG: helix-turn-helix transcriptional regulator [Bacteroidales bacterium]|nr:helix-turn-helix transcriptional regulator [Bacteroidales bacterium]